MGEVYRRESCCQGVVDPVSITEALSFSELNSDFLMHLSLLTIWRSCTSSSFYCTRLWHLATDLREEMQVQDCVVQGIAQVALDSQRHNPSKWSLYKGELRKLNQPLKCSLWHLWTPCFFDPSFYKLVSRPHCEPPSKPYNPLPDIPIYDSLTSRFRGENAC